MNYTKITLGELLSSANKIVKRNATSILKQLQKGKPIKSCDHNDIMNGSAEVCHECGELIEFHEESGDLL